MTVRHDAFLIEASYGVEPTYEGDVEDRVLLLCRDFSFPVDDHVVEHIRYDLDIDDSRGRGRIRTSGYVQVATDGENSTDDEVLEVIRPLIVGEVQHALANLNAAPKGPWPTRHDFYTNDETEDDDTSR